MDRSCASRNYHEDHGDVKTMRKSEMKAPHWNVRVQRKVLFQTLIGYKIQRVSAGIHGPDYRDL